MKEEILSLLKWFDRVRMYEQNGEPSKSIHLQVQETQQQEATVLKRKESKLKRIWTWVKGKKYLKC